MGNFGFQNPCHTERRGKREKEGERGKGCRSVPGQATSLGPLFITKMRGARPGINIMNSVRFETDLSSSSVLRHALGQPAILRAAVHLGNGSIKGLAGSVPHTISIRCLFHRFILSAGDGGFAKRGMIVCALRALNCANRQYTRRAGPCYRTDAALTSELPVLLPRSSP
jgi:hypothetical protein